MAAWECHDLTTLAMDHVAFVDAIVQLIERDDASLATARTIVINCTARWGATA
jgi:hypothetical protein